MCRAFLLRRTGAARVARRRARPAVMTPLARRRRLTRFPSQRRAPGTWMTLRHASAPTFGGSIGCVT
jgi:hypothetical protein